MQMLIKQSLVPKKFVFRIGVLYTILVTIAFLLPSTGKLNLIDLGIPIDKLLHIIIHSILAFIWLNIIFIQKSQEINSKLISITVISCVVYGIIIEISQGLFIESRDADFLDIIANSVGTLLGFLIFLKVKIRFNS
ncbi:MAG: VanZ family protein [Flavobacteriaceae bacterium]|nr:VanZ family protein [Flavobacteriaceae bacterium]